MAITSDPGPISLSRQRSDGIANGRRHPLLEKGSFEQLQRNDIIETRPHILHFGGFQIHMEHSHVLRVLNISPTSLRLAIIGPTTPSFRIDYDKKGLLAPGMSEEITVTFTPHEWRYYYDTVKIFCGELSENLIVPIHGYPSANDIYLPRIIDFGSVALGTSRTKVIPLSCKIPIQFEFDITLLDSHPDFEITPLAGVIPPDGTTNVTVTFLPTKHRTARTELQFNISQFDFEPVVVTIVGSCLPELSREEVLRSGASEIQAAETQTMRDAMTAKINSLKAKKGRRPVEVKPPSFVTEDIDRLIDGVKVPQRFDHQTTNFVLSQTAGKLPLKDLSSFIKEQRDTAERRRKKAEASNQDGDDVHEAEDIEDDDRQAIELRFEMQYREIEKYDKEKELKGFVATGENLMSEDDIARCRESRGNRQSRLHERRIQDDMARVESALHQDRVAVPDTYKPALAPHWDENVNDMFSMRLQVIDRFVRAGSKCLMRVRAQKRLEKLREAMHAENVTDRGTCRFWVDAENKAAAAGGRGGASDTVDAAGYGGGGVGLVNIARDFVLPPQLPTAQPLMNTEERQPIEVEPLSNFEEFHPVRLKARLDYKVLEYERYTTRLPAAYMRPCDERQRLHGALEELSVRGQRGDIFDGAEVPMEMPASCLLPPQHDPLSLLVPSTECRTYIGGPEFGECDFEYRLSQPVPVIERMPEPLLPPDLMMLEEPLLARWRRPRRVADPFEHFDPIPACFAEAGGKLGPRLGADAGGERLSFLPVGGFSRDIPSDTDSDERDDFQIPAPGPEAYDRALELMSGPLSSDLWQKQRRLEERLNQQMATNNSVVRDRLRELNKELDHRNKLYLG